MNANLDSWDGFISGSFLKASDVSGEKDSFVCTKAEPIMDQRDSTTKLRLTLEFSQTEFLFDLNKTNGTFLKNSGIATPKDVIGKKLYFNKVRVFNPELKKEVDGLRISKVE